MKNMILKSLALLIVMSLLNAQLADWTGKFFTQSGVQFGMLSASIIVACLIITVIAWVTILLFRKSYDAIWKIAVLFEVLYLLMLLLSGTNPFTYFVETTDVHLTNLLLYINSIGVFIAMCLFDVIYSRIILSKVKN
ncbi:hypothetical protein [Chryseobacterium vrystaatense]|uniref:Uncharacterized protein n=1 Tax=Chryseobacterium vrystaatense TaxID=307480 RepID=A0A1M5KIZ9_9FLAO|nr:hypothetical protein [Chryseobacterium vrystaatense]KFF24090.1 hypothetical protein IW16_22230 [Chryseobacterium vrystaatense]SHG52449.1 hypothetical protein SAMN02787073_4378 [Chryseobacterium vrystaatense]